MRICLSRFSSALGVLLAVLLLVAGGCADEAPKGSVSGTVTLDGQPLTSGVVVLLDEQTGVGASAELDSEGGYQIESIATGTYQVGVQEPPAPAPHEMTGTNVGSAPSIPSEFRDPATSGLSVTVEEGKNAADFAL